MASGFETFQDLNLSRDEVERIGEALKDKEFRKLLTEYVEEIRDPENRKLYEKEVTQLEKERGMDVKFINPIPGYVIKTSANGTKKAFINVASNEQIGRPTSTPTCQEGHRGLQWSLPHTLSPPRDDYDSKRIRCLVYDVVFHPDTLRLAKNSKQFKNLVNSTARESIEKGFNVQLDEKNFKFPNLLYKGADHPSIIRSPSKGTQPPKTEEEQKFLDELFSRIPPPNSNESAHKEAPKSDKTTNSAVQDARSKYTTPKYVIKHRSLVDMQEYTYDRDAKENVAIPRELVVDIFLPMLRSSEGIALDVTEKTIQLISETPAKYKLNITLPYAVRQESGNAKFEKDCKKLVITLPVIRNKHFLITDVNSIDDSGVESDHGSPTLIEDLEDKTKQLNVDVFTKLISQQETDAFFDNSIDYTLPEHFCQVENNNHLNVTFKAKNVNDSSIEHQFVGNALILIKFTSISTGFFPINYGIILQLSEGNFDEDSIEIEAWDNNVVAQISVVQTNSMKSYFYGSKRNHLTEVFLDSKSIAEEGVKHDQKCENNSLGTGVSENVSKNKSCAKINVLVEANTTKMDQIDDAASINIDVKCSINSNSNTDCIEGGKNKPSQNEATKAEFFSPLGSKNEQDKKSITNGTNKPETLLTNNILNNDSSFKLKQSQAVNINRNTKVNNNASSSHCSSSPSSSCDEHSSGYSCSPVKNMNRCKGILKQRMRATRSISESGLDDAVCCIGGSMENGSCCHSVEEEGDIPEEESSLAVSVGSSKKTVRFSDNISQQLFRSNSSILGQKKKNQRKARNKKRAQVRRHSESEICDTTTSADNIADHNGNRGANKTDVDTEAIEIGKDTQFDLDM